MSLKCVVCNEEFNEKIDLRKHSLDHDEEDAKREDSVREYSGKREYKDDSISRIHSSVYDEEGPLRGQSPVHHQEASLDRNVENTLQENTSVHNEEPVRWGLVDQNPDTDKECSLDCNDEEGSKEKNTLFDPLVQIEYKRYQCQTCSKYFTKNGHLKVHSLTHTSHRPYKCNLCEKSFTQSGNLKRHLATHINERPKQCTFCNQTFSLVGQLKLHLLTHTDGRPYQCTLCEKSFTQKGDLNRHMLVHSKERPHECHVCKQKFKQSAHLKGHLLTHTGERPYHCTVCEKSYKESGHLKRHMQTHINDRPHQCVACGKSFVRSEHLKRHLLTHSETQSSLSCLVQDEDIDELGSHILAPQLPCSSH